MSKVTQTMALTDFLLARIAEDETVAREAAQAPRTRGGWGFDGDGTTGERWETRADAGIHRESGMLYMPAVENSADAALWDDEGGCDYMAPALPVGVHIARHDPARVLAECEAKRRIVEECRVLDGQTCDCGAYGRADDMTRALATVYADHPDYREEWKP